MPELRYRDLIADIGGIVWEAELPSFRFTFVSEQAERLLGYPREQWLEPGFWPSHLHPDDHDWAVKLCLRQTAAHRKHDFEYRMVAADGTTVWLRDIVSVVVEKGEATKLRGVMVDITERKLAEEQLQAHLWFLESMDKVNRAMHGATSVEKMMSDVLKAVLAILGCDGAWLLYPCNPEAPSWSIEMEHTQPEYPGPCSTAREIPMSSDVAEPFRIVRAAHDPVRFGAGSEYPLTRVMEQFQIRSILCAAMYPKVKEPYVFGVHQCSRPRLWTHGEERFVKEVSRRLADALTILLAFQSLSESKRKLAEAEHLAHVGYWERDFVTSRFTLSDEARLILGFGSLDSTEDLVERERKWLEAIHPDDRERAAQAIAAARGGDKRYDLEYRVVGRGGEVRTIHSRGDVTRDDSGSVRRMFGFMQDITERRRAEEELFESNERFRLLAESSLTGIYLIQDDVFLYANPAFASIFGYSLEELVGELSPRDLVYPEDWPVVAENLRRRIEGEQEEVRYQFRGLRKDGSMIYVEVHGRRIEHGDRVGVIGTLIEITQRRKAEDRLRASEARFRTFVDHATDAFFLYDDQLNIVDMNHQACDSLGYQRRELTGMPPSRYDQGALADPSTLGAFRARLKAGEVLTFDSQHRRKDGSTFPVEVRLRPFWEGGRLFSVGLARDTTERKQAEWALSESHSLLRSVIEGTSDAVFVKDLDGRYVMINSAGAEFLGKSVDEVIGKDDSELFSPETAHIVIDHDRQVMESGKSVTSEETATASGVTRTYLATKGLLRNAHGRVTGLIGISHDVTELKRLEEQFRQAQKMEAIGRLAGGVAHDFNNILMAINGYCELAMAQIASDNPIGELLSEIGKAGERATTLTRQLLAFSRKQVLHPQVVNLNDLIGELRKMLRTLVGEDVELAFAAGPDLDPVKVDPGQFEQALINLAINARDAMPRGGQLAIQTCNVELGEDYVASHPEAQPARYVQVSVTDSGQGMDTTTRERIFEPFFTTKEQGKGTGLGLAMVYGFLKQSGGHVEVYSEPGYGTTFKIYLPSAAGAVQAAGRTRAAPKAPRGSETILLVEDDEPVRKLSKRVLESCGYDVLEARDGIDALRVAEEQSGQIHILVTDMVMPRLGGHDLIKRLTRARPEMKVILTSGYTDSVALREQGPDFSVAFLQKPFSPDQLARKVRESLDASTGH